jgi:hypothetical protein
MLAKQNYMTKYFINYECGSDLLMSWLSLFLARQHLSSGTNLRECEDQSWFKVQAVPVFRFDWYNMFTSILGECILLRL